MIDKVKKFLTAKRCKSLLKNNRGFSLLEVLVAVAIIGIISGIAIPQFTKYRNNASKVAFNTSGTNVAKAFKNCIILNEVTSCNTLEKIGMKCPSGATCPPSKIGANSTGTHFCAEINGRAGAKTYNVCVEIALANNDVSYKYGGTLVSKICKYTQASCTDDDLDGTHAVPGSTLECTTNAECTAAGGATACAGGSISGYSCDTPDQGVCTPSSGTCS